MRLYYTDSYLTAFDARVCERLEIHGRPAVVLDRSAFYPASGGQPFDTGLLGGARVLEVAELDDGRVAHVLEKPLAPDAEAVHGEIDWARRFDHMQQHTGQHVLSAAFDHVHGARTESFHLGGDASTVDFASTLTPEQAAAAEDEANRIVWEDRPVTARVVSPEEALSLPLRKEPVRSGPLRLVEIEGFDLSACGGTHVSRTGAVGLIAIIGQERFKGGTRVAFVCGGRALTRLRQLRAAVAGAVRHLSVMPSELPDAIERLQNDMKEQRRRLETAQARLADADAAAMAERAEQVGGVRLVLAELPGVEPPALKAMAQAIAGRGGHVAVLIGGDAPRLIVAARAADVAADAGALVKELVTRFGGKGGGRPELAQGGGLNAPAAAILAAARALVETQA